MAGNSKEEDDEIKNRVNGLRDTTVINPLKFHKADKKGKYITPLFALLINVLNKINSNY